jgi:ribokinase
MKRKKTLERQSQFSYDIVSVGSALRDIAFFSSDIHVIDNPRKDLLSEKLFAFESGAKLRSDNVSFSYGGGAANTSVNFAGLGLSTAAIASVGDDEDGDAIVKHFQSQGVKTTFLHRSQTHRTGFSFIAVDEQSGDRTAFVYYGASRDLPISAAEIHRIRTRWFYVSSLNHPKWAQLLTMLNSHEDARIAWNPGGLQLAADARTLKRLIKKVDVLIVNRDEALECGMKIKAFSKSTAAKLSLKALARGLQECGPGIVVVTNGRQGAAAANARHEYFLRTPNDTPVDTTGAGDCYGSSFVAGLLHYAGNIPLAMDLAQANSSALVKKVGAQNGLLQWKQLPRRLQIQSVLR